MALDKSGELQQLVEQFQAETDIDARNALLPEIIYRWAGVYDMDPEGRNPSRIYGNVLGDSRKLEALEEFWGGNFSAPGAAANAIPIRTDTRRLTFCRRLTCCRIM